MARRSKRFEYGKGIYYFMVKKGYRSEIIIKRNDLKKALMAYKSYEKSASGDVEWLGKWQGDKFIDTNFTKLYEKNMPSDKAA